MTTSKLMKRLRSEMMLTQKQFGKLINISQCRISEYEKGKHKISIDKFFEICEILNIEPKNLM